MTTAIRAYRHLRPKAILCIRMLDVCGNALLNPSAAQRLLLHAQYRRSVDPSDKLDVPTVDARRRGLSLKRRPSAECGDCLWLGEWGASAEKVTEPVGAMARRSENFSGETRPTVGR